MPTLTAAEEAAATVFSTPYVPRMFITLQVKALFEKVQSEQGRLDILVNNAFALGPGAQLKTKFWMQGVSKQGSVLMEQ